MPSMGAQKRALRREIRERLNAELAKHPERAVQRAIGFAGSLLARMSLEELREWLMAWEANDDRE